MNSNKTHTVAAIRTRYLLGLSIIALLVTGSYFSMQRVINAQANFSRVMNLAGHQAGLANRIAFFASLMATTDDESEFELAREQVRQSLDKMEHAHRVLIEGSQQEQVPLVSNMNLQAIYFDEMYGLETVLMRFLGYARNLLTGDMASISTESVDYIYLVTYGPHVLEPLFEHAVNEYETLGRAAIYEIEGLEKIIWLTTLAMLLLELLVIFRPMEKRIRRMFESLNDSIQDLRDTQDDLITAKKDAEMANHAKNKFLATMSHEIRTPLNGVIGMTEVLASTPLNDEQLEYLKTVTNSSELLLSIINDILDFSKLEAGKVELEEMPFNLEELAFDVLSILRSWIKTKNISLVLDYPMDAKRELIGDPSRVRQVLFNLVGNAIKFTQQGHVIVRIREASRNADSVALMIDIEDTGIGIKSDQITNLFLGFNQLDNSTTRRYGGTGLGLSITRQLVRLMQGDIRVRSEYGKGSVFTVEACFPTVSVPSDLMFPDLSGATVIYFGNDALNRDLMSTHIEFFDGAFEPIIDPLQWYTDESQRHDAFSNKLLFMDISAEDAENQCVRLFDHLHDKVPRLPVLIQSEHYSLDTRIEDYLQRSQANIQHIGKPIAAGRLCRGLAKALSGNLQHYVQADTAEIEAIQSLSLEGKRILLVEDVQINQKVAVKMLQQLGLETDIAENGAEAVDLWKTIRYDLILMDCRMPVMDGYAATRVIRSQEAENNRTPIVALTANASEEDQKRCLQSGMDDMVTKPFKKKTLEDALRKYIFQTKQATEPVSFQVPERPIDSSGESISQKVFTDMQSMLEDDFNELISSFYQACDEVLETMAGWDKWLAEEDYRRQPHSLKSVCGNIGAIIMSELAAECEQQIKRAELTKARATFDAICQEYERVKVALAATGYPYPGAWKHSA